MKSTRPPARKQQFPSLSFLLERRKGAAATTRFLCHVFISFFVTQVIANVPATTNITSSILLNLPFEISSNKEIVILAEHYTMFRSNTVSQRSFSSGFILSAHMIWRTVTVGYRPFSFSPAFCSKYLLKPGCV